jgi:hypothetical protein
MNICCSPFAAQYFLGAGDDCRERFMVRMGFIYRIISKKGAIILRIQGIKVGATLREDSFRDSRSQVKK